MAPRFLQNRCYAKTGWDRAVRQLMQRARRRLPRLLASHRQPRRAANRTVHCALQAHETHPPPSSYSPFAHQIGMLPLTGTSNAEHMRLDLTALDSPLERADLDLIENLSG